jgi:hypothetical protein
MFAMRQVFHELELAGQAIEDSSLAVLSLSITTHINRLGCYEPDSRRRPAVLEYSLFVRPVPSRRLRMPAAAAA